MKKILLCAILILSAAPSSPQAGEVVQCGAISTDHMETYVPDSYCDIHARRFAYAQDQKRFREELLQRQRNYVAPQLESMRNYDSARHSGIAPAPQPFMQIEKIKLSPAQKKPRPEKQSKEIKNLLPGDLAPPRKTP